MGMMVYSLDHVPGGSAEVWKTTPSYYPWPSWACTSLASSAVHEKLWKTASGVGEFLWSDMASMYGILAHRQPTMQVPGQYVGDHEPGNVFRDRKGRSVETVTFGSNTPC